MDSVPTSIPGCLLLRPAVLADDRGVFVKPFSGAWFREKGLEAEWEEQYYSVSRQGVLRGLHFQVPPHDHAKLVHCPQGEIFDAVVDLREDSPTFGRHACFRLGQQEGAALFVPRGLAHGFYVLSHSALVCYSVSSPYSAAHDLGVRWDSAAIPWPDPDPVLSPRDRGFPALADYSTPFRFVERR